MDFPGVTYVGPDADDREVLERVPEDLRRLLEQVNGLVAFDGGLHIRGAVKEPLWHSLRHAWTGGLAFHERYASVQPGDVPFAQDAVGDQWLLRDGRVVSLASETGELEPLGQTFGEFLEAARAAPVETLGLEPLMQFHAEGGTLPLGRLLNVYPPFCTKESADGVDLSPVPAIERLEFLADLARQMPPSGRFRIGFE
jgi:hypothetical protein